MMVSRLSRGVLSITRSVIRGIRRRNRRHHFCLLSRRVHQRRLCRCRLYRGLRHQLVTQIFVELRNELLGCLAGIDRGGNAVQEPEQQGEVHGVDDHEGGPAGSSTQAD